MFSILLIDDDPTLRLSLKRLLQNQGYEVTLASNGEEGIAQAKQVRPALIICDWMMPDLDGLEVCRQIKSDPELETTFFILLTAREANPGEEDSLVVGLNKGADDFLSKPISNKLEELKARVKAGLRLHLLNQKLRSLNQDLQTQKLKLEAELAEAAEFVRSLLPSPLKGTITTQSCFIPSAQLGGDCFDYYWLDDEHLALYLLDVSGHGVGAALLSVSVLNILRSQSLPHTNFHHPSAVLTALNLAFSINQGDKYFTIWYGVYNPVERQLVYSNAGHPPAILFSGKATDTIKATQLGSPGLPIGILPIPEFEDEVCKIAPDSSLYIFSDGAYELQQADGNLWSFNEFVELLTECEKTNSSHLDQVLDAIKKINTKDTFDDDFSLLKINF